MLFRSYSCLGVQAILKHHTGAISEAQMEQTLHELASQGFRYYDDVKKYGKRNPFSQQYNLNIGRGTEKNTFNASLSLTSSTNSFFVFICIISYCYKHCHFFSAFEKLLISLCFVKGDIQHFSRNKPLTNHRLISFKVIKQK